MVLISTSSMLFLVAVLVAPGVHGMQPDQGRNDDPQDPLPRHPFRPKRWPGNPWQRATEAQEESRLQRGMGSWMENPTVLEFRNPDLTEEPYRDPYNPSFSGGLHLVGPFENPYDNARFVVKQSEPQREEITLHPSRRLENTYNNEDFIKNSFEIPRDEMISHSLWSPENTNDQGVIMMDHHVQPVERKFIVNSWTLNQPGYNRRPGSVEVAKDDKNFGTRQPDSTDKLIRSVPDRWNEFVINSIIKLKYGGDDVFDISEFNWIRGQDTLSASMIEDMLRWNQPDGGGILVPKLLKDFDSSVARFEDQGKWKFPGNSLQIYTVPLSIVKLFRDFMKSNHVQAQSIIMEPKDLWYDWKKSHEGPEEGRGHLHNRHAVDFRDYHDFDFVPNKELPLKDPVLLGQEDA